MRVISYKGDAIKQSTYETLFASAHDINAYSEYSRKSSMDQPLSAIPMCIQLLSLFDYNFLFI